MKVLNRIQFAKLVIMGGFATDDKDALIEILRDCDRAVLALQKLVDLKELKDQIDAGGFANEADRSRAELAYSTGKPLAWGEARAALLTTGDA